MEETRQVILSAKDIEVKFRVRDNYLTAIRNVSLDLYQGETFAIVGESGSGKSVFTKTFTGMLESNGSITNGSVMFEGKDLTKLKTDKDWEGIRGAKISTIFQDPMTSLNPIRTIGSQITEVIEKHQGVSRAEAKKQAIQIMERVGIVDAANRFDEYPFQYSGGMRQRIVIAIALSCHPEILICDEPTTALDVTIQAQIISLIRDLQKELGFTTLYITHDLGVVANVADRVGVMYGGQIIEYGTVEEVFFDPRHPYTWALLSSCPSWASRERICSISRARLPLCTTRSRATPSRPGTSTPSRSTLSRSRPSSRSATPTTPRPGCWIPGPPSWKSRRSSGTCTRRSRR